MGRIWEVADLDCSENFATNARRVIRVRVAEVYAHSVALDCPADEVGLHDLRISIKRLRYSLEFFAVCFDVEVVASLLDALSRMQEWLGQVHDADVLTPDLHRTIGQVEEERATRVRAQLLETGGSEAAPQAGAFKEALDDAPGSPYELGFLGLLDRLRAQREAAYVSARDLWRDLNTTGMREKLESLAARPAASAETA
jgi:hypothetical protein